MPIRFACPDCKKPLTVSDDRAGAKVACPACKTPLRVPPAAAAPASAPRPGPPHALDAWDQVDGVLGGTVEVVDRRLDTPEEGRVRASLTGYADAIPHHDRRGLGKQVKITKVREFRSHRVVLDSLYEKRHVARKQEPFGGTPPPPATTTEANIRVWDYPHPTPDEFKKAAVENRVEDSRQVAACQPCSGHGKVTCPTCTGSGAVPCSGCGGSGGLACRQCGGSGQVKEKVNLPPEWTHCTACRGGVNYSGDVCMVCNGTAMMKEHYYQERTSACGACSGRGTVSCTSCGGRSQVRCQTCSGNKSVPCSPCKATGKMISYLAVVQSFEPATQTIPVPCAGLKDAAIAGSLQPADFTPFLTLATTAHPAALKLTSGFEKLRGGISKAFDIALARGSDESRLVRQRLQVGVASVLEVGYEHEGGAYTAWFVGKQLRVHAPVSPVTDALHEMVKEAVRAWKKGDRKAATLGLREVLDMAAADPSCQRAYDEVRDTIPADLESKAKWVRWKPFIIAGVVIAGLLLLVGVAGIGYSVMRAKNGPPPPGAFDPRGGAATPGGRENLVLVEFRQRSVTVAKGGTATLRLTVHRLGSDRDVTVRLDAGRGLTVPAQVVMGRGQEEAEVEVRAGDEAGVFVVKATVEPENPASPPAECRVSVGGGLGLPGGR